MDKLNIDFKSLLPYVIDAFSSVYGEEYRSIISKKINNTLIISYHDFEGLRDYVSYLKRCKGRELSIRFLDEVGIDVQVQKKDNYSEPFDSKIRDILECFIDSNFGFDKDADYWSPLLAFDSNNKNNPKRLLTNKIKIINYLLGNAQDKITEENFESFTKTKEFLQLLEKINEFKTIYEKLLSEYKDWAKQLAPYEKYIEDEKKRKEDILQKKKNELFREVFDQLQLTVKDSIYSKTFEEQQEIILGSTDISSKSNIEAFRYEQMEKLKSPNIEYWDKFWIVYWQSNYFKKLGITIPNEKMLECNSEEDITNYLTFLNQDDIKKYIPTEELISYISTTREKKYEEALREYYTTRKDFTDAMKTFTNNQNNLNYIYYQIKNKKVCIAGQGGYNDKNEFFSIMFYTVRINDGGYLLQSFMHECGHIIDQIEIGTGFEHFDSFDENIKKNPYNNAFRKYEKFNETLNDMFTIEAIKFLQSQGIYLIEPKELTILDTSNCNTASITKNLLQPLLQKFKKQVIKAKINSEPQEFIKYIGEDNFEELVDAVNKVDYLSRNGVMPKIDNSPEYAMVIEYFEQIERVKQIYNNIDNYYDNKFGDFPTSELEGTTKKR